MTVTLTTIIHNILTSSLEVTSCPSIPLPLQVSHLTVIQADTELGPYYKQQQILFQSLEKTVHLQFPCASVT